MKIKTLLVCFLAVCTLSLTSCSKKNKDYTENFVGNYDLTITPSALEMSVDSDVDIPGLDEMIGESLAGDLSDIGTLDGVLCNISKVGNGNDVNVTLSVKEEGQVIPLGVIKGSCDEVSLQLNSMTINQTLSDEMTGIGDVSIKLTLGSSAIQTPVNGKISWTSGLTGSIGMDIPTEMGINIPITLNITGNLDMLGTKK